MSILLWLIVAALGACAFGVIAVSQGETINAMWLIVAAMCTYAIGYRFYAKFIASRVMELNDRRLTPAHQNADGLDYVPTQKSVLFGHHFAAIAGAGPLVGPVLAAQMGYLPSLLWLLIGVVIAGAVQDMMILFASTRRNGRSLGEMIRGELGSVAGVMAMLGIFAIMVILLAVLSMVVVKALIGSAWAVFTLLCTVPIAVFMGVYSRWLRPGKVGEVSVIGIVLLMLALWGGSHIGAYPELAKWFIYNGEQLAIGMMIYGFIASILPVWLLLAPRDYLSTFLKIGTIVALAIGIFIAMPPLKMPALTDFIDGTGPVFAGQLFPFLFITIACGAVSGFHSLVSSGTTPKMIDRESHIVPIGYGAMLTESFVAVMALIAACVLDPGIYFAMNSPAAVIGTTVEQASAVISSWGFVVTPEMLTQLAHDVGEASILSRTGGAPTFAVGMAKILSDVIGGQEMMAFWYHFAILFEAMFILTTVDAGTRVARFMLQDLFGVAVPALADTRSWVGNILATGIAVGAWGWFLYQGVTDPFGGINSLWALFGIANQMLAGMALLLGCVLIVRMGKVKYLWVTLVPTVWLLIVTITAGLQKIFSADPAIGFLSHAAKFSEALARGEVLAPTKSLEQMQQVILNDYINSAMAAFLLTILLAMVLFAVRAMIQGIRDPSITTNESPIVWSNESDWREQQVWQDGKS